MEFNDNIIKGVCQDCGSTGLEPALHSCSDGATQDHKEKENVTASLNIELNVVCPSCTAFIDLVEDTDLNEEGWLLDQALPDGCWAEEHQKFKCDVVCPECKEEFKVKGISW